jgi:hypothetical protein
MGCVDAAVYGGKDVVAVSRVALEVVYLLRLHHLLPLL